MGNVSVVTGFCPIPGHPRAKDEYVDLFLRWSEPVVRAGYKVHAFVEPPELLALREFVTVDMKPMTADNPEKNTIDYLCTQHQKFIWLYKAYMNGATGGMHPDRYIWLDYGITHVPGVTAEIILEYLRKQSERTEADAIEIPGCWDEATRDQFMDQEFPNWRFCGGLMNVPSGLAPKFCVQAMVVASVYAKLKRKVTWEVNSLARLESLDLLPMRWYKADHNQTMFTEAP